MASTISIPPGRSGRMWLRRRIATAEQGRDQLDRKLRILVPEQQRLRLQAARMRRGWEDACAEAGTWLLRATLLGGQDTLRAMTPAATVDVEITWTVPPLMVAVPGVPLTMILSLWPALFTSTW